MPDAYSAATTLRGIAMVIRCGGFIVERVGNKGGALLTMAMLKLDLSLVAEFRAVSGASLFDYSILYRRICNRVNADLSAHHVKATRFSGSTLRIDRVA
jgi:hypothetical protein